MKRNGYFLKKILYLTYYRKSKHYYKKCPYHLLNSYILVINENKAHINRRNSTDEH